MGRPTKSKELEKAIEGTLRPDRDRIPLKRTRMPMNYLIRSWSCMSLAAISLMPCASISMMQVLWQVDAMILSMYCKNWELLQEASDSIRRQAG